jgi:hypothetical protein
MQGSPGRTFQPHTGHMKRLLPVKNNRLGSALAPLWDLHNCIQLDKGCSFAGQAENKNPDRIGFQSKTPLGSYILRDMPCNWWSLATMQRSQLGK